jgi:hypothetical protein
MQLKPYLGMVLSALFICASSSSPAQSAPDASERKYPLAAGVGFSGYNPDFDGGHLLGGTLWIDYPLPYMPWFLNGFGIVGEARDIRYGRSASLTPYNLRQDVAEGGINYSWRRHANFHPYGKFLFGYGNTDYGLSSARHNDSRTIGAIGGGFDYRVFRRVWVRGDYEYQFWPDFFKHPNTTLPAGQLNPQGITIGAMYHFSLSRAH